MGTRDGFLQRAWSGLLPWLVPIGILLVWEATARFGWLSVRIPPEPLAVLKAGLTLAASGELWQHVKVSHAYSVKARGIAGVGIPLPQDGLAAGTNPIRPVPPSSAIASTSV